jgi:hypothetical protein
LIERFGSECNQCRQELADRSTRAR